MGNCWACLSGDSEDRRSAYRRTQARGMPLDRPKSKALSAKEADAVNLRNQTESPFLRLPPELRHAIYVLVLGVHRHPYCRKVQRQDGDFEDTMNECRVLSLYSILSITRTCRQIHAESSLIYFQINYMSPCSWGDHRPDRWRRAYTVEISKQQRNSIRHWWTRGPRADGDPYSFFPGIQTIVCRMVYTVRDTTRDADEAAIRYRIHRELGSKVRVFFVYENGEDFVEFGPPED